MDSRSGVPTAAERANLDAWFERDVAPRFPAAVVGIVAGGQLVWHRAAGSRDGNGGPPPDRTSMFRIGSITKVVTAVAVMQLRDRGIVELDAPVAKWVPELAPQLAAPGTPAVTLRHLMTHTSGLASLGDGSAPYWQRTPPTEAAMLEALAIPLTFPPGSQSAYSNAGMALAGLVVARASEQPYRDYMAREVLAPIGMAPAWDASAFDANQRVAGVSPEGRIDPPTWQLGAFEPAGGLWASLDHMVALAQFALGRPRADKVLAATSRRQMTTQDPLPGPHGAAWVIGEGVIGHTGSTSDYSASFIASLDDDVAAIVLAAGPEAELVDCIAMAALRAVTKRMPPDRCEPSQQPRIEPSIQGEAFERLLGFLANPDETRALATFAPSFLAAVPLRDLLEMTKQITALSGACASYQIATPGAVSGKAHLTCAKGKLALTYVLDAESPGRFLGLQAHGVE